MPPFDILRPPDQALALGDRVTIGLAPAASGGFEGGGIELETEVQTRGLLVRLRTTAPLNQVQLRWKERVPEGLRYMSDTWDQRRACLEWRGLVPERPMPWYFMAYDGQHTHGVGVRVGAAALCEWHVDPYGVTLSLDVRNGGAPVEPGDRELALAEIVVQSGRVWEAPFQAARRFVAQLGGSPLLPDKPVYGMRCDRVRAPWDDKSLVARARLLAELADNTVNRPFLMVDRGWQRGAPAQGTVAMRAEPELGDLGALAHAIAEENCRPGLWLRPLLSSVPQHQAWSLPPDRFLHQSAGWVLDPTHPAAVDLIQDQVRRAVQWGFELIRHDFTLADLLGDWDARLDGHAGGRWRLYDRGLTTAEALRHLYTVICQAAEGRALIGASDALCHLAAGRVHIQSISNSGGAIGWEPTRRLGINALAFRGFHHGALYAVETDPVTLGPEIPWSLNEQWLRLLASSGATCFVSMGTETLDDAQRIALHAAFYKASRQLPLAEPLDWLATTSPGRWKLGSETASFDWFSAQYGGPA